MKALKLTGILFILVLFSGILSSCKDEITEPLGVNNGDNIVFDMDLFEQNIIDGMNFGSKKPVGWAYAITKDGSHARSGAFGKARLSQDLSKDFKTSTRHYQASVSKFYTAIGAMKILHDKGLSINSPIEPWLPQAWERGPGIYNLKFKDLLRHESGLSSNNSDLWGTCSFDGIQQAIKTGVVNPQSPSTYLNVNFALFRILIPSIWRTMDGPAINIHDEQECADGFIQYMQENVFEKAGLTGISCVPDPRTTSTLYYSADDVGTNNTGTYYTDRTLICGGGGFYLSVIQMAVINAFFNHSNVFFPPSVRDEMRDNDIAYETSGSSDEEWGEYYPKNGSNGGNDPFDQGMFTQIVHYPFNGVEVALATNCHGFDMSGGNLRQMLYDAYNNAWVTK